MLGRTGANRRCGGGPIQDAARTGRCGTGAGAITAAGAVGCLFARLLRALAGPSGTGRDNRHNAVEHTIVIDTYPRQNLA